MTYTSAPARFNKTLDGKSQYLHIKYSDDGETFTENDGEELGAWIGTLVDYNEEDSTNFKDYTWKKFTEDVDDELAILDQNIQYIRETTSKLVVDEDAIRASVSNLETTLDATKNEVLATQNQVASMELQSTQLEVKIESITTDGVTKIRNTTGIFDEDGMTIDRTDSSTKTQITPDGMTVYRKGANNHLTEVLEATSYGVNATNLYASTYLIVGGRSRFENYGEDRTGCFWIGGD